MKRVKTVAFIGHDVPAQDKARIVEGLRGEVIVADAFAQGRIADIVGLRAADSYAFLLFADTLEQAEALAVAAQAAYFERQDEVIEAVAATTALAVERDEAAVIGALSNTSAALSSAWTAGEAYGAGHIVSHEGADYLIKQDVLSLEHQATGSLGMLAVYRPIPRTVGGHKVWVYGMDVERGDTVWCGEAPDARLYTALQPGRPSIHRPGEVGTEALWELCAAA